MRFKKYIYLGLIAVTLSAFAAQIKISQLTSTTNAALGSASVLPIVNSVDSTTYKVPLSQLDLRWATLSGGLLPLSSGGTNKNMTPVAGGLVYSDADSQEVTSAGTASDWVLSGGVGAPTMSSTTTTAKVIDGSADAVQLNVQGHSTQTNEILNVEKSDGTDLLSVTNTSGTKIRGTTTNDAAATGFVGEIVSSGLSNGSATSLTTGTSKTVTSISLTAGDWKICGGVQFATAASTSITALHVGSSLTTNAMPAASAYMNPISNELAAERDMAATVPGSNAWIDLSFPCYRASVAATTTFYLVSRATFTVSTMSVWGFIQGERIR